MTDLIDETRALLPRLATIGDHYAKQAGYGGAAWEHNARMQTSVMDACRLLAALCDALETANKRCEGLVSLATRLGASEGQINRVVEDRIEVRRMQDEIGSRDARDTIEELRAKLAEVEKERDARPAITWEDALCAARYIHDWREAEGDEDPYGLGMRFRSDVYPYDRVMAALRAHAAVPAPTTSHEPIDEAEVRAEVDSLLKSLGMDSRGEPQSDYVFASAPLQATTLVCGEHGNPSRRPEPHRNRIRCLSCMEAIESTSAHDFRSCSCGKTSVDGGGAYQHVLYSDAGFARVNDDGSETKYGGQDG